MATGESLTGPHSISDWVQVPTLLLDLLDIKFTIKIGTYKNKASLMVRVDSLMQLMHLVYRGESCFKMDSDECINKEPKWYCSPSQMSQGTTQLLPIHRALRTQIQQQMKMFPQVSTFGKATQPNACRYIIWGSKSNNPIKFPFKHLTSLIHAKPKYFYLS